MNKIRIIIGLFFLASIVGLTSKIQAAQLKEISATPSDVTAGNTASYTLGFKTSTAVPSNGKITIEFPAGFNVAGVAFNSWTGFDGGQVLAVAGQVVTLTRSGGSSSAAGAKTIVLDNIVNTAVTGNEYAVIITTKTAVDAVLDGPTDSLYFQIFSSHSETDIDGMYYLRDDSHTHNQKEPVPGLIDIGTMLRSAPTSDEFRFCTMWVQFYFDENGTYTQANQINNIYYHVWWVGTGSIGTLGYDTTGSYDFVMDESFEVYAYDSRATVENFYLTTVKQEVPTSVYGNAIYNFGVKFLTGAPILRLNPDQSSFVILNLEDDITLQGQDSDSDGLNDYDELFTYYTNPYDMDTDNDTFSDLYEVTNSMNPNDSEKAPSTKNLLAQFHGSAVGNRLGNVVSAIGDQDGDGREDVLVSVPSDGEVEPGFARLFSSTGTLLRQFSGLAVGDGFGCSISSISDQDGDGKEDVLAGASNANGSGSAYICSSSTGDLIRQFNGFVAGDHFGTSISSIGDQDDDGKEDVLVGAPNANGNTGSAYIYSSSTGNLIRQFNGSGAGDDFGCSVSAIGDQDDDGKEDVLIGAIDANGATGSAYIYSSSTGALIRQFNGDGVGHDFGHSVSSIGDQDDDGKDDVLVGAIYANPIPPSQSGSAYLYSSTGVLIRKFDGDQAGAKFGFSVSRISDQDGDGKEDILVGESDVDRDIKEGTGSLRLYSLTGALIKRFDGFMPGDNLGCSVSFIGDQDNDGKEDILVGSSGAKHEGRNTGSAYIYSSDTDIPSQSWAKSTSNSNAFDLDYYFMDPNNQTLPDPNQILIFTASTVDNPYIDVSIDAENRVSFSQPNGWVGTEEVVFTATDPTDFSSQSNTVTLEVTGERGISGQVTLMGGSSDVTDVVITLSGDADSIKNPGVGGDYDFTGLGLGSYIVTPLLEGYYFFPENYSYPSFDRDQLNQDFMGVPLEINVNGSDDDDDSANCCIATAVYGSPMSSEIKNLRKFRDEYLLTNPVGEVFVKAYYEISSATAHFIKECPILKNTARDLLYPLVWMGEKSTK